jgi:UTP--glucose-1-phosphate uridylyltransferase
MNADRSEMPNRTEKQRVRKAVIPAAGLGTRFLPATKSSPKEMLPVVDKPAIQYVVEEAVQAGLTDILIITGRSKRAVEDHFDRNFELEHLLEQTGKHELLKQVQFASDLADIHYVRQRDPLGLGHAVSVARHHVGNEPFAVLLADDIMVDEASLLSSLLDIHDRYARSAVALQEVDRSEISSYGCVEPEATHPDGLVEIKRIVEKPPVEEAPSNLAVIGRYVFTPEIFDALDRIDPGAGGELQLTDAIALLLQEQSVFGRVCSGGRFDVGQKMDFLRANVELALDRPDFGATFAALLRESLERRGFA